MYCMEILKPPFGKKTKEEAQEVLDRIRENHPEAHGWREIDAGIEVRNGLYYAWRKHEHL